MVGMTFVILAGYTRMSICLRRFGFDANIEEKKSVQESLDGIEKNVSYINKIVADLQDFARLYRQSLKKSTLNNINLSHCKPQHPWNVKIEHFVGKDFTKLRVDQSYLQRILTN